MADRWRIGGGSNRAYGGSVADKLSPDSFLCWLTSTVVLAGNCLDASSGTRGRAPLTSPILAAKPPDASGHRNPLAGDESPRTAWGATRRTAANKGGKAPTDLSLETTKIQCT
ncbi:hypothetical protein [Ktedonobacter sp. SOSP1-52]|uniref:hypothetical protein n=1 Tax=Ktedonobacter sp. SOSP1-52 TaxID=2778366 RepID=UPI0019153D86|nr:hypothetical protein [Ktedonobacter sp. SOSP1-52]